MSTNDVITSLRFLRLVELLMFELLMLLNIIVTKIDVLKLDFSSNILPASLLAGLRMKINSRIALIQIIGIRNKTIPQFDIENPIVSPVMIGAIIFTEINEAVAMKISVSNKFCANLSLNSKVIPLPMILKRYFAA